MHGEERIRLAHPAFDPDEIEAVVAVLRSGNLVQGEHVATFERQVAAWLGVREAIACSNGTSALHLALLALNIGPGDEVIIPDYTYPATANMIEVLGATPVLVDIDLATFNLDTDEVAARLTRKTRAILPVHLFGLMADMRPIVALAASAGVPVIEDAACALGSSYPSGGSDGQEGDLGEQASKVGAQTAMACLSFHPRKVITTAEGGMVVTSDPRLANVLREMRNHGGTPSSGRLVFEQVGFNYRMTEIQGALGVTQMRRLLPFIARRRAVAAMYDQLLGALPVSIPYVPSGFGHVYQSYVVLLPESVNRDEVISRLKDRNIESTIGTYAIHLEPYYRRKYQLEPGQFPNSATAARRALALPIHPRMTEDDVRRVVSALAEELEGLRP